MKQKFPVIQIYTILFLSNQPRLSLVLIIYGNTGLFLVSQKYRCFLVLPHHVIQTDICSVVAMVTIHCGDWLPLWCHHYLCSISLSVWRFNKMVQNCTELVSEAYPRLQIPEWMAMFVQFSMSVPEPRLFNTILFLLTFLHILVEESFTVRQGFVCFYKIFQEEM